MPILARNIARMSLRIKTVGKFVMKYGHRSPGEDNGSTLGLLVSTGGGISREFSILKNR